MNQTSTLRGLLAWLVLFGGYAWLCVREHFNGLFSDSYVYLAAARELAAGRDMDAGLLLHIAKHWPFPPLYPLYLALAGGSNVVAIWCLNAAAMAAAVLLVASLAQALGVGRGLAIGLAGVFALLPGTLLTALNLQSEPVYMALVAAALVALESKGPTGPRWWRAAALVGLATLTRTVGVAALAGFLLCWWCRGGRRAAPLAWIAAVVPALGWQLLGQVAGFEQYRLFSDFQPLVDRLQSNLGALRYFGQALFDPQNPQSVGPMLAVLGLLALLPWWRRLRECRADAWYLLFYAGVLAIWPHPAHAGRFIFAVLPLLMIYAVLALLGLAHRLSLRPARGVLVAAGPLAMGAAGLPKALVLLASIADASAGPLASAVRSPQWHTRGRAAAEQQALFASRVDGFIQRLAGLPAEACVASVFPDRVLWLARRRALDLLPSAGDSARLMGMLRDCPYVLMVNAGTWPVVPGIGPFYPGNVDGLQLELLASEPEVARFARLKQ